LESSRTKSVVIDDSTLRSTSGILLSRSSSGRPSSSSSSSSSRDASSSSPPKSQVYLTLTLPILSSTCLFDEITYAPSLSGACGHVTPLDVMSNRRLRASALRDISSLSSGPRSINGGPTNGGNGKPPTPIVTQTARGRVEPRKSATVGIKIPLPIATATSAGGTSYDTSLQDVATSATSSNNDVLSPLATSRKSSSTSSDASIGSPSGSNVPVTSADSSTSNSKSFSSINDKAVNQGNDDRGGHTSNNEYRRALQVTLFATSTLSLITLVDQESSLYLHNPVEDKYRTLVADVGNRQLVDLELKPNKGQKIALMKIINEPSNELTIAMKDLVWRFRFSLVDDRKALTKFLLCVDWGVSEEVVQATELLFQWRKRSPIDITDALKLLGKNAAYQQPIIRSYAVDTMSDCSDDELVLYLLQLVQAIKYDGEGIEVLLVVLLVVYPPPPVHHPAPQPHPTIKSVPSDPS
jgi:hypothetical protein